MNTCEKFNNVRRRNDRALGNGKSDNNENNVGSTWGPISEFKTVRCGLSDSVVLQHGLSLHECNFNRTLFMPGVRNGIRSSSGTSSFSNDTVRFTTASTHACYNGDFGI